MAKFTTPDALDISELSGETRDALLVALLGLTNSRNDLLKTFVHAWRHYAAGSSPQAFARSLAAFVDNNNVLTHAMEVIIQDAIHGRPLPGMVFRANDNDEART